MTINKADSTLLDEIYAIEQACFADPWSKKSISDALESDAITVYTASIDGCLVGFMIVMIIYDDAEILDVAVAESARRCGVASELFNHVLSDMMSANIARVFLEVRESNTPATELYNKFGFIPIGRRKKYYRDPAEDAVLMEKYI